MNEASNRLEKTVTATVAEYAMLPRGCTVIVGVSGGADSMALLHWLCTHAKDYGIQVVAAHLHHGLRGAQADGDAAFVRDYCDERGIPLRIERADVRTLAQQAGEGVEACGRRLRYAFFERICKDYPSARIATAHTLSDNAETMLLHLTRGAGAAGLSGIPPVRGAVIRPLLGVSRREVEAYCAAHHLDYRKDATNDDPRYARNRVRKYVVPQLKQLDPRFEEAAGRAARALREDETCLRALGEAALARAATTMGLRTACLQKEPRAVRMRALSLAAARAGAKSLSQGHLDALDRLLFADGGLALPGGVQVRAEQGTLLFGAFPAGGFCVPLQLPETILPDGRRLSVRLLSRAQAENLHFPFPNCMDYDTITSDTAVRTRLPGDRFRPAGRKISKPLRKLQNELHLPASLRDGMVLLADGAGLLWAQGCGPAQRSAPGPQTRRLAVVEIKECTENGK